MNARFAKQSSFPAGSAGGPDSLRPHHIRYLLMYREAGPEFLSALTAWLTFGYRTGFLWWAPLGAE